MKNSSMLNTSRTNTVLDLINKSGTNDFESIRKLKKLKSSVVLTPVPSNYLSSEDQ